jgi:hypothetical protein
MVRVTLAVNPALDQLLVAQVERVVGSRYSPAR